jgi:hypothetical protein
MYVVVFNFFFLHHVHAHQSCPSSSFPAWAGAQANPIECNASKLIAWAMGQPGLLVFSSVILAAISSAGRSFFPVSKKKKKVIVLLE